MDSKYLKTQLTDFNLKQIEIEAIKLALIRANGNRKIAARLLNIAERFLYRKETEIGTRNMTVEELLDSMVS